VVRGQHSAVAETQQQLAYALAMGADRANPGSDRRAREPLLTFAAHVSFLALAKEGKTRISFSSESKPSTMTPIRPDRCWPLFWEEPARAVLRIRPRRRLPGNDASDSGRSVRSDWRHRRWLCFSEENDIRVFLLRQGKKTCAAVRVPRARRSEPGSPVRAHRERRTPAVVSLGHAMLTATPQCCRPISLMRSASSSAISSNGFTLILTPSRHHAAAVGFDANAHVVVTTRLMQTMIFCIDTP